jgi:hypothetical protein
MTDIAIADNIIATLVNIPSGTTLYVPVPIRDNCIGAHVLWRDAVSSAAITLELSSTEAAAQSGSAADWGTGANSPTITGPAATGAGCAIITVTNINQRQARLKIVTAAITNIEVRDGSRDGAGSLLAQLLDATGALVDGMAAITARIEKGW